MALARRLYGYIHAAPVWHVSSASNATESLAYSQLKPSERFASGTPGRLRFDREIVKRAPKSGIEAVDWKAPSRLPRRAGKRAPARKDHGQNPTALGPAQGKINGYTATDQRLDAGPVA